jgi:hypothetical protein
MMTTAVPSSTTTTSTDPRRGDDFAGGRFVGETPHGTQWVSYEGESDFRTMCETFDRFYGGNASRHADARCPAAVA